MAQKPRQVVAGIVRKDTTFIEASSPEDVCTYLAKRHPGTAEIYLPAVKQAIKDGGLLPIFERRLVVAYESSAAYAADAQGRTEVSTSVRSTSSALATA